MLDLEAGDESHPASQAIGFVDVLTATTLVFIFLGTIIAVAHTQRLAAAQTTQSALAAANVRLQQERDALLLRVGRAESSEAAWRAEAEKHRGKTILIPNELQDHVLFATGQAVISRDFYPLLETYARTIGADLQSGAFDRVVITGHTDNVPIHRWCINDNWDLGGARSLAIARFLISRGIPPFAITVSSNGEFLPVGDNRTWEGRAANRRIEVVLIKRTIGGAP